MMAGMRDESHPRSHPTSYYSGGGGRSGGSSMDDADGEDTKTNGYISNNYISGGNINGLSMFSEEKISQALRVFLTDDR